VNELLLGLADDELVIGWRDSEWTGIAPMLEEDVAFSSIAQNEIGHARAVYELLADDADALAFDRSPEEYRCAPLVQLELLDWAHTIARRWLYEVADEIRITALMDELPLAKKINREEAYHRMHAETWRARLAETPQFRAALDDLWPYAVAVLPAEQREALASRVARDLPSNSLLLGKERGSVEPAFAALHDEMTIVRRSAPAGAQW
jgi:ring-1,2-phenylacetyl-CoA epoxidase subunit PaaC